MPMPQEVREIERNKYLEEMKDAYERVFSGTDGQKVLEDIKRSGVLKRSAFDRDPLIMAFNEGKRDLAQNIVDLAHRENVPEVKQRKAKR